MVATPSRDQPICHLGSLILTEFKMLLDCIAFMERFEGQILRDSKDFLKMTNFEFVADYRCIFEYWFVQAVPLFAILLVMLLHVFIDDWLN